MAVVGTDLLIVERAGTPYKTTAADVAALASGPTVTVGTTAPGSPAVGDFWVDTN